MKIAIFVSARSELGLLLWTIKKLNSYNKFSSRIFFGGGITSKTYGSNDAIEELNCFHKITVSEIPYLLDGNSSEHISKSIGIGTVTLSQAISNFQPDLFMILGDRYDLLVPASVATIFNIPIIHIAGGDITYGAIDNNIRYAVTKLSHIHIVQTKKAAENVSKVGEEDWRIVIAGGPGIENIYKLNLKGKDEIKKELGVDLDKPTILCTYHPATLENEIGVREQIENMLEAINYFNDIDFVITYPGADAGSEEIIKKVEDFSHSHENVFLFKDLGIKTYLSIMKYSKLVLGNSSSGILEAPSLKIPTVNIGKRQDGRERASSVIDCGYSKNEIIAAMKKALSEEFRNGLVNCKNPYDPYNDGNFSERVIQILNNLPDKKTLLSKKLDFEVNNHEWNKFLENR